MDPKLEKFAVDLFYDVEKFFDKQQFLESLWKEYGSGKESDSVEGIHKLVSFRLHLFSIKLMELEKDVKLYKDDNFDFYNYILNNMSKYYPYAVMKVYDKISMSCAVAAKMNHVLLANNVNKDILPLAWAKYFLNNLYDEFNGAGGWEALRTYAEESKAKVLLEYRSTSLEKAESTDFIEAHKLLEDTIKPSEKNSLIGTFKQRLKFPVGSSCCPGCLPLYDAFFFLSFEKKLVNDFPLVEGMLQILIKTKEDKKFQSLFNEKLKRDLEEKSICNSFFETSKEMKLDLDKRIFQLHTFVNSVENYCLFCRSLIDETKFNLLKEKELRSKKYREICEVRKSKRGDHCLLYYEIGRPKDEELQDLKFYPIDCEVCPQTQESN